jgi:chaperonin GroEL
MQLKEAIRVTETVHGEESHEGLLNGVKILHDPVASTLGAAGRTVIIEDIYGNPKPTKDGVTVAKAIVPLDSVERMGCEVIKQASMNTAKDAGDGTTTSTILAKAIIDDGMQAIYSDRGVNYTDYNRGMQIAVDYICDQLDKDATPVNLDNIDSVAAISANNDPELGQHIADAFRRAGEHGVVLMEKSQTAQTYVSLTEGFELEKGYKSDVFITDKETNRAEYKNAAILVSNVKIERIDQIEGFAEYAIINKLPFVVVSEMEDGVVAALAMNKVKGTLNSIVVEPSHFGDRRKDILTDLAISTGATLIDDETGDNFDVVDFDVLGRCRKVTIDKAKSVFFNDISDEVKEHINALKVQIDNTDSSIEKKFLEERIAKISSSVAVVYVGASSSAEQSEKADRVDDAIHATRAALAEGIVAGGGVALHNIAVFGKHKALKNKYEQMGYDCVINAITEPLKRILINGDIKYDSSVFTKKNIGIDVRTKSIGNMIKMNIIDPVRVTKSALRNAVSAATTLLSTSTTIVNLRRA